MKPIKITLVIVALAILTGAAFLPNCTGWILDYGKPAAQFESADLAAKGDHFIGRKVTVRGKIVKVDTATLDAAKVFLDHGIRCDLGKFQAMAESYEVGSEASIDGILKRCDPNDCLLAPAIGRDPKAPFAP